MTGILVSNHSDTPKEPYAQAARNWQLSAETLTRLTLTQADQHTQGALVMVPKHIWLPRLPTVLWLANVPALGNPIARYNIGTSAC